MLAGCPVLCSVRAACASAPLVHSSPPALFPALGRQNSYCVLLLSLPAGDIGNALPVGSGTGGKRGRAASPLRLPVCRLGWLMTTVRCELRRHPTPSLSPSTCRFLCVYLATLVVSLAEPRGGSGLAGVSQVKKPSRKKPIKGELVGCQGCVITTCPCSSPSLKPTRPFLPLAYFGNCCRQIVQRSAAKLSSEAPGTYELCGGLPVADAAHVVLRDGDGSGGYFYSCELRHPTLPNPGKVVFVPMCKASRGIGPPMST